MLSHQSSGTGNRAQKCYNFIFPHFPTEEQHLKQTNSISIMKKKQTNLVTCFSILRIIDSAMVKTNPWAISSLIFFLFLLLGSSGFVFGNRTWSYSHFLKTVFWKCFSLFGNTALLRFFRRRTYLPKFSLGPYFESFPKFPSSLSWNGGRNLRENLMCEWEGLWTAKRIFLFL